MGRRSVPILWVNMATGCTDFSHINQMGSDLIFEMQIKQHCDNEQISQGDFWYTAGLCIDKRVVCIAPDKV